MSYQALYRVWRPQSFDDLVGQEMIAETLKNAIKNNRLSHAYLFTGPRGTGKTSAAKILAKAVNCPNQHDGNPCNECEICQAMTKGQLSDVIEIDAASNNGVEEIRELRDKVRYAPTVAHYKVYIIDEVHMLTTGAFNALLKTLEEPPAQVLFILATTEPHKIPATIISRTQRFDFQRLHLHDLISRMKLILETERIDFEEEALAIIARAANGGMRDSLSLLDQALSYNRQFVSVQVALEVSGSLGQQIFSAYLNALNLHQSEQALEILSDELHKGKQASRFIEELILFARDILLTKYAKDNHTLLSEKELVIPLAIASDFYYRLIDQLNQVQNQMRFSNQPDLFLEVMTIQMAQPIANIPDTHDVHDVTSSSESVLNDVTRDVVYQELTSKIQRLEQQVEQLTHLIDTVSSSQHHVQTTTELGADYNMKSTVPKVKRQRVQDQNTVYHQDLNRIFTVLNEATKTHIQSLKTNWTTIIQELPIQQRNKFVDTEPIAAGDGYVLIQFNNPHYCGLVQHDVTLNQTLSELMKESQHAAPIIAYITAQEWPNVRKQYSVLRRENGGQPVAVTSIQSVSDLNTSELIQATDVKSALPQTDSLTSNEATVEKTVLEGSSNQCDETSQETASQTQYVQTTDRDNNGITDEQITAQGQHAKSQKIQHQESSSPPSPMNSTTIESSVSSKASENSVTDAKVDSVNDTDVKLSSEEKQATQPQLNDSPTLTSSKQAHGEEDDVAIAALLASEVSGDDAAMNTRENDTTQVRDTLLVSKAIELFGEENVNIIEH